MSRRLNPVEVPNVRQNTPPIEQLEAQLCADEAGREELDDISVQIEEMIRQVHTEASQLAVTKKSMRR